jgi:hypothetical protein
MAERKNSIPGSESIQIDFHKNPEIDIFDNMTAFSPPEHEDHYLPFQLTTRKGTKYTTATRFDTISEDANQSDLVKTQKEKGHKNYKDLAQHLDHLDSCKKFIVNQEKIVKGQAKSSGVDDGFKSAVCSSKLLKMAEKMMSNKQFVQAK